MPSHHRRIYMTIVAGAAVGIWGITGLPGFYAYLASQALVRQHTGVCQVSQNSSGVAATQLLPRASHHV